MLPIDIINIILSYVSDLNNDIMITQYHPITNKEYYMINYHSDLLLKISANVRMKYLYPTHSIMKSKILYTVGTPQIEKELRQR